MQHYASVVYAIVMCLCNLDVTYRRLNDWTSLQWALYSLHTQRLSAFSVVRGDNMTPPRLLWGELVDNGIK